ncbi:homing endonuclease associated repeat-containing protein [Halobacterium noricense]|uniref:homing endonuclease associated repeat-containing protein n=1 Tax=Halobacterium noricense TaxID=223182 RepID=UPI001E5BE041|nr:hypothetical protein [Halobacterium noricense]UHH25673.1 hypothetical protein LT974_01765 [Halobacterium noricense]
MPRPKKYSDEELLDNLRELAERVSEAPPTKAQMNDRGPHGARTYQDRWGSWSAAVEAAGFEPREVPDHFEERPDACPLCGSEETGLDFHHWKYADGPGDDEEVGCYFCRDCHDRIHEGKAKTANTNWLVHCVANLVAVHIENHPKETDVEAIIDRYSMTDVHPLVKRELQKHIDTST